ncbi:uncharacterized protein F5147DRAFT_780138 [Suillus discolor]|uniref:Uncharacterized protein n=1 Tax=Suillus discolor TaxID=1912936 RepID=A0A9P7EV68_9AGAM|nr:uncharacterized protein F5147DRAFT_780138 [Suillus discolor]KAG2091026.1 hypothetical protein F5147DRAFT_780138 [Suillus discolor]
MVRKLTFGRVFSRSRDTDRPPAHPYNPPPLSPISIDLPLSQGSKFKEEAVSAIFTATAPTESITGSLRPYPSPKLQKRPRRVITTAPPIHPMFLHKLSPISSVASSTASFEVSSPLSTTQQHIPSGVTSFCPATHPAESFTEDYRLQIPFHQNPYLTVLEKTSPEQFMRCIHLLRTSLPTNLDAVRDIMPKPNGFVHTVLEAYNNHRALILRPDDVWTAILIQFSFFVSAHAEQLSGHFAAHGREELIIIGDRNRHTADYAFLARQMLDLMHTRVVDPMLRDWIMPEFSTTTDVDRTVYAMSMMATMKEYFRYKFVLRCGIPVVTLLGERHDWEAILERLERLKIYSIETIAWYHLLHPIISRFVAAFDAPSSSENLDFWSKVAHYEGGGSGPTYLSGWITAFCVFNEQGMWQGPPLNAERMREDAPKKLLRPIDPRVLSAAQFAAVYTFRGAWRPFLVLEGMPYPIIDDECVPCGYAYLDVKLDDHGHLLDTVIVAGAVGTQICSNDKSELFKNGMRDSVRPVVGYWYFITGAG